MMQFTATSTFTAGRDDSKPTDYEVRYTFTVRPARAQRLNEPAERPEVGDITAELKMYGKWWPCTDILHDMIVAENTDALEAWLLVEAQEQAATMAFEAADHRRRMQMEEAA